MTTTRAKREREAVRAVWAVTLALLVGSYGVVLFAPRAEEDDDALSAVEVTLDQAGPVRAPVTPTVVSRAAGAPKGAAPAPGVLRAPAPAPRRVVVVRRSRAS